MMLFVIIVAAILTAVMLWHNRQGVANLVRAVIWFILAAFICAVATGAAKSAEAITTCPQDCLYVMNDGQGRSVTTVGELRPNRGQVFYTGNITVLIGEWANATSSNGVVHLEGPFTGLLMRSERCGPGFGPGEVIFPISVTGDVQADNTLKLEGDGAVVDKTTCTETDRTYHLTTTIERKHRP
jgi:hypothetical protein